MVTTIQQALRPLLVTSSIIGLGIYSRDRPRPYLSILYSLAIWIGNIWLSCYLVLAFNVETWFLTANWIINIQSGFFTTLVSIVMVIYYDKKFRRCIKRLAAIDDTLEQLGTAKTYRNLYLRVNAMIIMWVVYYYAANSEDMLWWFFTVDDRRVLIIPNIINHFRHVNVFVDLSFIIFVWYIGTRFDKVNEHVRCLLVKEEHGLRCLWNKTVPTVRRYMYINNYKRVLWTSMHLHLELCQIARELNTIYGTQITLQVANHVLFVAGVCHYLYIQLATMKDNVTLVWVWFDVYFWVTICMATIVSINYICESVSVKASKIKTIIHQLTDPLRYADVRNEIYQFTLQVIHHPLKFTGLGLFYFGYGFLRKYFLTVVTFVIFKVQISHVSDGHHSGF